MTEQDNGPMQERLRALRKGRGMTLKQVSEKLSLISGEPVHFTTVGKLETGKMELTVPWVDRLASVYEVSFQEIIRDHDPSPYQEMPLWFDKIQTNAPVATVISPKFGTDTFAVHVDKFKITNEMAPMCYVVIDPDDTSLVDGNCYLIEAEERRFVASYDQGRQRFLPLDGSAGIRLGATPFRIVGRGAFVGAYLGAGVGHPTSDIR